MKSTKGAIAPYSPAPPPSDLPDSARRYLDEELHKIAGVLQGILSGGFKFDVSYAPPDKPRTPMIAYADGTQWNPGSGEGFYCFNSMGVWTPL